MLQLQHQTTPKKPMTQQEHLKHIRARCVELLEIAEKRTPGLWIAGGKYDKDYVDVGDEAFCTMHQSNAAFIASCAGAAEAGWRATIAAIDTLKPISESEMCADEAHGCDHPIEASEAINSIIASWPAELL